MVQGLSASTAGGAGSIPGGGTKIPRAALHSQKYKNNSNKKLPKPESHFRPIKSEALGGACDFQMRRLRP